MNILITNDDGIYSPGIAALSKMALQFGTVRIVAPDVEQSSMGHAITHSRPLSIKSSPITFENIDAHRVNGTPADCVALGLHMYPDTDVVLSGINMGPNLGNSMWHSGTLAAAKQAVLLGVKGVALSTPVGKTEPDFEALDAYVAEVLNTVFKDDELGLYNVNFPPLPKGIKWTRQSVRLYDGHVVPGTDPMERKHYWITVSALEPAEEDTDRWAVENDYVSITPLRLDLTDEVELEKRKHDQ
ncbi:MULTISPECIES: 5'/3'-nucleotidase SurE [unclassified Pedobacter]|uniref:5'/3'-nucleotidase SurE n=1 Tax=Pedobacter TaxID=84567 RepID=UPI000B4ABC10|nr:MULTISPECIES: 5'/3'-nucleotidase SurE [unclassified Pedobacter]MCX2431418.1 5'/3'-nucleotidase SurE [Pedobacter sp. GR22-10]MCX2584979.1 5'/3'-nucleotidase SurE [Pedobacter sp. MR22-3]OWK71819.1 5'/3'-nucleotidase SurE [Pedobacter sp. AJM]